MIGVNKNTAQLFFHIIRELIAQKQNSDIVFSEKLRQKKVILVENERQRSRGLAGKVPVFGLLKRGERSLLRYFCKSKTLLQIIKEKITS